MRTLSALILRFLFILFASQPLVVFGGQSGSFPKPAVAAKGAVDRIPNVAVPVGPGTASKTNSPPSNVAEGRPSKPMEDFLLGDPSKRSVSIPLTDWEPIGVGELYRLNIGDRLLIAIYGEHNTERDVIVDSEGEFTYPIIGTVSVFGKTIEEVRELLNEKISKFFRYTFIAITPIEFGGQNYTILGQVLQPGSKVIYGRETLLSAICRAGGFPVGQFRANDIDLADLGHSFLLRRGEYVPVDFAALIYEGDLSQDVELKGGDYIFIPSVLDQEIFVLGEVFAPGVFSFLNSVTLLEAVTQAGGIGPNGSSRVLVVRGSLCEPYVFSVDIQKIYRGCACDFRLQPGDLVYVPPRRFTYLRQLVQSAIQTFVGSLASSAGTAAFESAFNTTSGLNNVNVIPTGGNTVIVPTSGSTPVVP